MRLVTLAMAAYGQPRMLQEWFDTLIGYPSEIHSCLELLIVDDCGTPPVEIPDEVNDLFPVQLFRVTEDIPWNQPGARNLALDHCRTRLVLFVDPDMVFGADMMRGMISAGYELPEGEVIRFMLKHRNNGQLDGSSPNTWFCHVDDFRKVNGYDEDYAGHKGWSDVQLLDVMRTHYKIHHRADLFASFYSAEHISDALVTGLDRNTVHNRKIRVRKVEWSRNHGGWKAFVKEKKPRIRFKWEQVL